MDAPPPLDRIRAEDVSSQEELRAALVAMTSVRRNLRAIEADTGLSKTTIAELRRGRRRVSLDSLDKIVAAYLPAEAAAWRQAWFRVNQEAAVSDGLPGERQPAEGVPAESVPAGRVPAERLPEGSPEASAVRWWRRRPASSHVAAVAVAVAVLEAGLLAGSWWASRNERMPAAVAASACLPRGAGYRVATVRPLGGARAAGVALASAGYVVGPIRDPGKDIPRIQVAGALAAAVPAGRRLILVERGDPQTRDSTPDHNPANGRYYPQASTQVIGGCFLMPSRPVGYSGFAGIRITYTAVLVDASRADAFLGDWQDVDGYAREDLRRYGLIEIGSFDVATLG